MSDRPDTKAIIAELRELQDLGNEVFGEVEAVHVRADTILCILLEALGFKDVVDEYLKVPKWYA